MASPVFGGDVRRRGKKRLPQDGLQSVAYPSAFCCPAGEEKPKMKFNCIKIK